MVSAMASAYEKLSEEDRERVFLLAVGKNDYKRNDQNFCKGFAACPDDTESSWWKNWEVSQRDVFFYIKMDDDSWEFYCRYSMNDGRNEFANTINEMLAVRATMAEDVIISDIEGDDFVGNETYIEPENTSSEPVPAVGSSVPSYVSSSGSSTDYATFLIVSLALTCWSII